MGWELCWDEEGRQVPWFYLQAEDVAHRTRRRDFGHSFLQSGAALTAWLLAMCKGEGCRRVAQCCTWSREKWGQDGRTAGRGGELGFVLSLFMTGGCLRLPLRALTRPPSEGTKPSSRLYSDTLLTQLCLMLNALLLMMNSAPVLCCLSDLPSVTNELQ